MKRKLRGLLLLPLITLSGLPGALLAQHETDAGRQTRLEDLGRALFFDVSLSRDRTQSCATCHDPARAFTDWRDSGVAAAASLGNDLHSLGDRNAPTASYASLIPPFGKNQAGEYAGGLFWDGRANSLEEQAGGPPMNPIEMGMTDKSGVIERLQENANYLHEFTRLFGQEVFSDQDLAYQAMTMAIAAFERSGFFAPFDSRYDRYLQGQYTPTEEEALGMTLFFSNQFTNCNKCHQLQSIPESANETFSNYSYQNIGVPVNRQLRQANNSPADRIDQGLLEHPGVSDPEASGKFRVPGLRNVAITAPYMHNGVFRDLRTVIMFYNKYLTRGARAQINPETGEPWDEPEVNTSLALEKLQAGRVLDERGIDALVAFMRMLTDRRYEALLEPVGSETAGSETAGATAVP